MYYKIIYSAPDGNKLIFTSNTCEVVDSVFIKITDIRRQETRLIPIDQAEIKVIDDENTKSR